MSQIIEHEGVVTGLEGKKAFIKIEQTSACSGCHAKTFCTASDKTEKIEEKLRMTEIEKDKTPSLSTKREQSLY